jgi:hypothetical protein
MTFVGDELNKIRSNINMDSIRKRREERFSEDINENKMFQYEKNRKMTMQQDKKKEMNMNRESKSDIEY